MNKEYKYNPYAIKVLTWIGVCILISFIIVFIITGQFAGFIFLPLLLSFMIFDFTVLKLCNSHFEIKVGAGKTKLIKYKDVIRINNKKDKVLIIYTDTFKPIKLPLYTIAKEKRNEVISFLMNQNKSK